jgi:large subunit ribosomal protein L15
MINLHALKGAPGSHHRRKIVGRGEGSGHGGKGSTRGFKGQTARSGDKAMRPGFEGGQMPLIRRIPKRGFSNTAFRTDYSIVNVGDLGCFFPTGGDVNPETLRKVGLVRNSHPVKVLGTGDVTNTFKVKVQAYSKSAREKIEKAGGTMEKLS